MSPKPILTSVRSPIKAWLFVLLTLALVLPSVAAEPRALCWQIRSGKSEIILLGSLHVGSADFYPLAAPIEAAFKRAQILGVEANIADPQSSLIAMQLGLYTGQDRLDDHISAPLLARLGKVLPRYGMSLDLLRNLRPFMLLSTLTMAEAMRLGYDPQAGVDMYFLQKAQARNMKIVELESIQAQMELMNGFTDKESEAMLTQTVDGIERDSMGKEFRDMVSAWRAGDVPRFVQAVNASFAGDRTTQDMMMKKLNVARNGAMADKIETYLRSGQTHFIVVGALHLVGEQGIIERLRKKNYQIVQL